MADQDQIAAEVVDQAAPEVGGDAAPFHSFTDDTGKQFSWKNPDELNAFLKKGFMQERDYTKKTQGLSTERSQFQKEREEFEKLKKDWETNEKAKYDRYNQVLSTRPAIQKALAEMVNKPASPDEIYERNQSYTDQKSNELLSRLEKLEQEREEERLERERDAAFGELEQEIQGFDRNVVLEALQSLDAEDPKSLMAMIYKASKYNPVEMQEEIEGKIAAKKGAKMVTGGGKPKSNTEGPVGFNNAKEEALREYASL